MEKHNRSGIAEKLRQIAEGIDGTGTADQLESIANHFESGAESRGVAETLNRLADGIDGTTTEHSIRQVANLLI